MSVKARRGGMVDGYARDDAHLHAGGFGLLGDGRVRDRFGGVHGNHAFGGLLAGCKCGGGGCRIGDVAVVGECGAHSLDGKLAHFEQFGLVPAAHFIPLALVGQVGLGGIDLDARHAITDEQEDILCA